MITARSKATGKPESLQSLRGEFLRSESSAGLEDKRRFRMYKRLTTDFVRVGGTAVKLMLKVWLANCKGLFTDEARLDQHVLRLVALPVFPVVYAVWYLVVRKR